MLNGVKSIEDRNAVPHSSTVDTTSFYVVWPRLVTWTIVTGVPDRLPDEGTTRRECPILSPAFKHFFPFFFALKLTVYMTRMPDAPYTEAAVTVLLKVMWTQPRTRLIKMF